jgi:hypothetical protein
VRQLSLWKEVGRPTQMASAKIYLGPLAGYVNSRIVERDDLQITKRNSLLNLAFLTSCGSIDCNVTTTIKNLQDDTNKLGILVTLKGGGRTILRSELYGRF